MQKIECSYYTLEVKNPSRTNRRGALLKIQFEDGLTGFADCHPWPELGDLTLENQIAALKNSKRTHLLDCSLAFARLDAEARHQKNSLLNKKKIPLSHFLIMDIINTQPKDIANVVSQGFTHVKIKMGDKPSEEVAKLLELFSSSPLKMRLDFNEKLNFKSYLDLLNRLGPISRSIDYIEDPIPFEINSWKQIKKESSIPIACDRQVIQATHSPDAYSFLIVKSALHLPNYFNHLPKEKIIVTSYLDHPLGQLGAAHLATYFDPDGGNVHGLLSHYTYSSNPFSQQMAQQGPLFKVPLGYGFGYDELLKNCEWNTIV